MLAFSSAVLLASARLLTTTRLPGQPPRALTASLNPAGLTMRPLTPRGKKPPLPVGLPRVTMRSTCCGVRLKVRPRTSVGTRLMLPVGTAMKLGSALNSPWSVSCKHQTTRRV